MDATQQTAPRKPPCRLSGTDGNAFVVIATVSRALKGAGMRDRADEWRRAAMSSESYDGLLALAFTYVDVDGDESDDDE